MTTVTSLSTPTHFTNWAGDESCVPQQIAQPTSSSEVAEVVAAASAAGHTVRAVGAGHSFGDIVCTDGVVVSLDAMSGITNVDAHTGLVTVGAGTRLYDFNQMLARRGLAMANLGDIDQQSLAGAISTATHGTGRSLGNFGTLVAGLKMVLADGTILTCDQDDLETLRAARVSLGSLGVITEYTLRTVPSFTLHAREEPMPLARLRTELDQMVDRNDHFEFFLFPHADTVLAKRNNRTDAPLAPPNAVAERTGEFVENVVLDGVCKLGRRFPSRIPMLNRTVTRLVGGPNTWTTATGCSPASALCASPKANGHFRGRRVWTSSTTSAPRSTAEAST